MTSHLLPRWLKDIYIYIYIYISHHIGITTPMPRPGVPVGAKKNFSKGGTKVLANLELLENNLLNWFILY